MTKLIATMDHLDYGKNIPQYVIEYGGRWYYGSSTVWKEVGGTRQGTMMEVALYKLFCKYEFEVKAGLHPNLKHYLVGEVYNMYRTHLKDLPIVTPESSGSIKPRVNPLFDLPSIIAGVF